jgi:signal transduction histidine kinase
MKLLAKNLNWLFLILVLVAIIISFFYLPIFWLFINLALLISLGILVFYNTIKAEKADLSLDIEQLRLEKIIGNVREGIVAYDQNFKILVFNPAAEQIFNIRADEIVGQFFTLKIKKNSSPKLKTLLTVLFPALATTIVRRSMPGAYPQIADISFDDPSLDIQVATNRIIDNQGNVLGFVKLIHDRTRELALLKSKGEFITVASHQLRTPLSGLNWAIESLKKKPLEGETKDLVTNASAAINRLMKITDDLLDVAKIEEGKFGYNFQDVDITKFLEDALTEAKSVALQYNIKLYFDSPEQPLEKIKIDPQKLAIVLSNLLDNAIKYNIPNGEVALKVDRVPNEPYIQISIRDTGIGIEKGELNKTFTKFFRAENAVKIAVDGTGLGLFIAKNIIRRHGGKIWLESTLNRGTTFYFTLPTNPTLIPAKEIIYEE